MIQDFVDAGKEVLAKFSVQRAVNETHEERRAEWDTESGKRETPALDVVHLYVSSTFRNCTYFEPRFHALLTEDGASRFELAEA
jgi:hypothetical protein